VIIHEDVPFAILKVPCLSTQSQISMVNLPLKPRHKFNLKIKHNPTFKLGSNCYK